MAAEDADGDSDAERAETYLRLRAEAELRQALTFRRYRQPMRRRVRLRVSRPLFAAMRLTTMPRGSATYTSGRTIASERATVTDEQSPRGLVQRVGTALRTVCRRVAFAVLCLRAMVRQAIRFSAPLRPPRAQACVDRIARIAGVLVGAGAISEQVMADVVGDMAEALAARSLIDKAELLIQDCPPPTGAYSAASVAGPLLAIPVGLSTEYEVDHRQVRACLGTLIVGAASAKLTVTARLLPSETGPGPDDGEQILNLDGCTAIDDRGSGYHACFSGCGDDERWHGTLDFHQPPSAGARWLDVSLPGAAPVRIDMNARVPALPMTSVPLPDGAADRYLDKLTLDALVAQRGMEPDSARGQELVAAASVLLDTGLIAAGSAAHGRFAAAAELIGLNLPPQLPDPGTGKLPDDWLMMLARWDSQDGPVGTIPLAAQLPDLEGVRYLLTGIESDRESASVQVHVCGWPEPAHHRMGTAEWMHWTARDDGGCLYRAEESQLSYDDDGASVTLELRPAIRPQARTLTINLTGKTCQVGVTVPLDWRVDE